MVEVSEREVREVREVRGEELRPECVDRVICEADHRDKFQWTDGEVDGITWDDDGGDESDGESEREGGTDDDGE